MSARTFDGWSEPVNLGPGVNSPEIDLCPMVTADGKYLFFLSQRDGESHACRRPRHDHRGPAARRKIETPR